MENQVSKSESIKASSRRPIYIFVGFVLIGAALVLVLFGEDLLTFSTSNAAEDSPQSIVDQVNDLSDFNEEAAGSAPSSGFVSVGDPAPNFTLPDLEGSTISLSDYSGQPVIMNLWATWCAPCRIEMPALQEAFENHDQHGLEILAINQGETAEAASQYFYDEMKLTFTPLLDQDIEVVDLYGGLNVLPTTYFIDQEGIVAAIHRGPLTVGQIDGYLSEIVDISG